MSALPLEPFTDEQVERVARAIHSADGCAQEGVTWEADAEANRRDYRKLAVAAIGALAGPGEAEGAPDIRDGKGYYHGKVGTTAEHRTVGDYRAWCHDCGEWCYPDSPCGEPKCCATAGGTR